MHVIVNLTYINGFVRHCIRQTLAVCSTYLCRGNGRAWCAMRVARRDRSRHFNDVYQ